MTTYLRHSLFFASFICTSMPGYPETIWHDPESDLVLSWSVFPPDGVDMAADRLPVAVLIPAIENEKWRQPEESDIKKYREDGMVVVVAERGEGMAGDVSTYVAALSRFHRNLADTLKNRPEFSADPEHMYFIPAGHRLLRDAVYWNVREHGWPGTMRRILSTYNGHVVEKFGVEPAETAEQMRAPDGGEIDYDLRLDLIYPKEAGDGAPLLVDFATQDPRMRAFRPSNQRIAYPLAFLLNGYAWAVVDHCWNPLARRNHFGYWSQYSLQDWNGLAAATAAIRFFKARAREFHLDPDAIGVFGHSKGSYAAMRLGDPNHADGREHFRFTGYEDAAQPGQPWPGHSSEVRACFISMGFGVRRTKYLTPNFVPVMAAAGKRDQFGYWEVTPEWAAAAEQLGVEHTVLMMEDLGHAYPRGWCEEHGMDRLDVVRRFFDRHLQKEGVQ